MQSEWNATELCDRLEEKKRVMVSAEHAGCGKSCACKAVGQKGHKVLFVCFSNCESGIALNGFSVRAVMSEDGGATRVSQLDDKPGNVIVFDEMCFASVQMFAKIRRHSELNPDKTILATGDADQLVTVDVVFDQINYDDYMNH